MACRNAVPFLRRLDQNLVEGLGDGTVALLEETNEVARLRGACGWNPFASWKFN